LLIGTKDPAGNTPPAPVLCAISLGDRLLRGELCRGALFIFILAVVIRILRDQTCGVADLKKS